MLQSSPMYAYIPALDMARARQFYEQKVGLVAREEVAAFTEYDFVVVNDEVAAALDELRSIVLAQRARLVARQPQAETIVRTFR